MRITPVSYNQTNQKQNAAPVFGATFKNPAELTLELANVLKAGEAFDFGDTIIKASGEIGRIKTWNNQDLDVFGKVIKNPNGINKLLCLKIQCVNIPSPKREYTLDITPSMKGQKLAIQVIKTIKTAAKNGLQTARVLEGRELPHNITNVPMPKVAPPKSE